MLRNIYYYTTEKKGWKNIVNFVRKGTQRKSIMNLIMRYPIPLLNAINVNLDWNRIGLME